MTARPTVFLDRDGTILKEVSYLSDASRTELLPGIAQALAAFQQQGLQLIVVSNQSGIARGLLDEGDLLEIQNQIDALLMPYGVRIDGYYHCPHHPEVGVAPERRRCRCRKPHGGMLDVAAQDFEIDWQHSVGIGDDVRDLQAFAAKDMASVLVGTGKGRAMRQKLAEMGKEPDLYCAHLAEAIPWVIRRCSPSDGQ
ncbi:MAG: HAD-IIIA family hydrolase [Planctomycetes bacterium]|nr:HAD-IIIA family hydrolase [Planctomycetota bacterium]